MNHQIISRNDFDACPDEILLYVAECLEKDGKVPARRRRCSALSQVDRRWRRISLPVLFRAVAVSDQHTVPRFSSFFESEAQAFAPFIRSIHIGQSYFTVATPSRTIDERHISSLSKFPNLRHFTCLGYGVTQSLLDHLAFSHNLRSLSILWDEDSYLPDLKNYPLLESLRVYHVYSCNAFYTLSPGTGWDLSFMQFENHFQSTNLSNLTKLVIHDGAGTLSHALDTLYLPNLRVLSLQELRVTAWAAFKFVERHPDVEEVNIGWAPSALVANLGLLVDLFNGTGRFCQCTSFNRINDPTSFANSSDSTHPWAKITLKDSFAFSRRRRPISAGSGAANASYDIVALGIQIPPIFGTKACPAKDCKFLAFLTYLGEYYSLEHLLLHVKGDRNDPRHSLRLESCMTFWTPVLRNWNCLRKLTLCSSIPNRYRSGYVLPLNAIVESSMNPPRIDSLNSPPILHSGLSSTLAHAAVNLDANDFRKLKLAVQSLLGLHELDPNDYGSTELLPAWEFVHKQSVERIVRNFAHSCRSVEELEWYIVTHPDSEGILWKWKVGRDKDAIVQSVRGELRWKGCRKGDPPPMYVQVGQEYDNHCDRYCK
ncbi:hypothetical protein BV22DRAFT_62788 [Leucogyrophana mollusca]|uniref:Uncharacterized protein n=1 Tax=Leucogyrophana mollusca TaxID=85980 RepID=A0ACB8BY25_9AGAM|nr:hypothetical protein BV22DRAFT_62788 [Leucogyrophana mollusca]